MKNISRTTRLCRIFNFGSFIISCLIVCSLLQFYSCSSSTEQVTISKEEYNKLKGIKLISPEYPKEYHFKTKGNASKQSWQIILGEEGHEFLENCVNNLGNIYICMHYPDCKLCQSRLILDTTKIKK